MPPSSAAPSSLGTRQRAKQACETCKQRKRKCDGKQPCGFCVRYEYDCAFDSQPRKRVATGSTRHVPGRETTRSTEELPGQLSNEIEISQQRMEATSGTAFPHVLGLKLNPRDAPGVYGISWNLGLREEPTRHFTNLTTLLTHAEMNRYAFIYFDHIHPIYAILSKDSLDEEISLRWQNPHVIGSYDPVLCGVAALGSVFSGTENQPHPREAEIVQCAKEMLEATSVMKRPLLHHATAWVLRTLYLRTTNSPHASWMASCTAMHIIEATGAHQDPQSRSSVYFDTRDTGGDCDIPRRLFWVTVTLNAWISNEYGRSRVSIRGMSCKKPSRGDDNWTRDLIGVYEISQQLDQEHGNDSANLLDCLSRLEIPVYGPDALQLSRVNLVLTIYRRLRISCPSIPRDAQDRIIDAAIVGLESAVGLAEERGPWWHVANVPFQVVCTLLAMDSRESLTHIPQAMRSLRKISQQFHTASIRHAVDVAESLVRLSRQNKQNDLLDLNHGLDSHDGQDNILNQSIYGIEEMLDEDGEPDLDWDAFLSADIPLFDTTSLNVPGQTPN
ncbi:uncharacterized protein KD926_005960 [Aspergillus affinis]|uniref:uncharacterized protein n=1 Tax=Aspergillus affinis TaxID=1070780 RepID=UPI0022FEBEE0|nr:uncharacterized protein KD926_005960 [Aspergillus affinis]KAI9046014.1 hypothetical protein KD926_005960 [Aspergillus affinis]